MAEKTLSCSKTNFHKNPRMTSSGSFTVTRATEQTTKVHISGSVTIKVDNDTFYQTPPAYSAQISNYAGMSVQMVSPQESTERLPFGTVETYAIVDDRGTWAKMSRNGKSWFHTAGKYDKGKTLYDGSFTVSYDQDLEWRTGNLTLYALCVWKVSDTQDKWENGNCDQGYHKVDIGSLNISDLPYNEYSPFSNITFSSITPKIGRYNDTDFKVKYSITGGTKSLTSVKARLFDMGGNLKASYDLGTEKGTNMERTFKVNSGGTGWHYKVDIYATDGKTEKDSGEKEIYTYVMPYVSNLRLSANNLTGTKFSPQDNAKVLYTTNARKWTFTGGEDNFKTKCKIGNSDETDASTSVPTNSENEKNVSQDNIEESLSADVINDKFTATERSVAVMNGSITISRVNTSASSDNYKKGQTLNFQVQFKPTNAPSGVSVTDTARKNVANTTIFINTIKTINVDWAYSHNTGAAGVVSGYKIEVFKSNSYDSGDRLNTYYQTGTTIALNTKTELKRGVMNYIKITPYYFKPNQTGSVTENKIILGSSSYTGPLVKPIAKLDPPKINYPMNGSTWHNRYFRVLAELPVDIDEDELVADGNITSKEDYKYKNIEIKVTPTDREQFVIYTNLEYPGIYNKAVANIEYTAKGRKIAICPALQSLDNNVSSYDVYVRVQKLYYNLTDEESWSDYTKITVKKEAISNLLLEVGDEIKQTHYATVRNKSVDLYNVYPIDPNGLVGNVKRDVGEKIYYKDYKAIYDTILSIRTGVNSYCVYDNIDVSFKRVINDLTNNPPKQEYITAAKTSTSPSGRNYMNILIDDMNLLY